MNFGRWLMALVLAMLISVAVPLSNTHGAPMVAKKKCHYVTKKVHGHKKKVKVCKKVSRATATPTAVPTDTPMPTPTATSTLVPGVTPTATPTPSILDPAHDVSVNLFEWNWPSIGAECTNVLGPAGYGSVQVAPPQDSYTMHGQVWWDVYQPADYNLFSRMGNETQFKDMVTTCRRAGVKVIVDAVINHTAAGDGVSYGGYVYAKYDHPGIYTSVDYHHAPGDCPSADGQIHDYNNYTEVTQCELLGLADLRTVSAHVRDTLAAYLNKMIDDGVSGFRVDAAKHIGETDLAAIESRLHRTLDGDVPFMALEVMSGGPGQLAPSAFEGQGSLLGFDFASVLKFRFTNKISILNAIGASSGWLPSNKVLVFVENHDTERNGSTLSYKDGATNILATEFMLAYGYGTPQVYASFNWNASDDSPPSDANGFVTATTCGAGWTCTDRVPAVINMVAWHNHVAGAAMTNWYTDGANLIAFNRGLKGWIAINNGTNPQTQAFTTGLAAGIYCDVIHAVKYGDSCAGHSITVNDQGVATVTVPAKDAIALAAP